ncbi:hypothetical protein [uncultured Kordia sp.]|uniref:hypothetical protein n=1 Tax=uncultured Kordia sp. TaxID=507699 RepID=UPI0026215D29|nr:hypothetical protein [uncultured Kordia sp.]
MKKTIFNLLMAGIALFSVNALQAQVTNFGTGSGTGGTNATYVGYFSGPSATAFNNSFFGHFSGRATTTGSNNSYFGSQAGRDDSVSYNNTFMGSSAGRSSKGNNNTFIGAYTGRINTGGYNTTIGSGAGQNNTDGFHNTLLGAAAGYYNAEGFGNVYVGNNSGFGSSGAPGGNYNVAVGTESGRVIKEGKYNVFLGYRSGYNNSSGYLNVFLGNDAGYNETGNEKLYIDVTTTSTPLIYGEFDQDKVGINTNQLPNSVGGANTSAYSLYVKGGILTEEVRVRTGWADYVFDADYDLLPINEVESFIKENGHLPNVPSEKQVEAQGVELGDITRIQQEKIEELTLYIIKLQKQVDALSEKLDKEINKK